MNESAKTGIFCGLAIIIAGIAALVARPQRERDINRETMVGKAMFDETFKDPDQAAKLKIVKFNAGTGVLSPFEVARNRETGIWTIPSASGYPADATDQMKKAAMAFLDKKILDIVSDDRRTHKEFGVIEPKIDVLEVGDEGVGMLVEIQDGEGANLVQLIVGNKVPKSEKQYFVRKPNQDRVYVMQLDTGSLSTTFTDWIEKDLLKLKSFDVREVEIKDYAILRTLQGASLARNFEAELSVDDSNKWSLKKFITLNEEGKPQQDSIPPGKELDSAKLSDLKNALGELKIADVARKPDGLSADLKADSAMSPESRRSLNNRGFYPQPTPDGKTEVFAANGELLVSLKDGLEYLLRFGEIESLADGEEGKKDEENKSNEKKEDQEKDPAGLNRYLLVTVRVNEDMIPPAELVEVPQTLEDLDRLDAAKKPKPPANVDPAVEAKPEAGEAKQEPIKIEAPAEPKNESPEPKPETPSEPVPEPNKEATKSAPEEPKKEEPANKDPADEDSVVEGTVSISGGGQDQEEKSDNPPTETVPSEKTDKSEGKKEAAPEETVEEKKERLEAEKERLTKQNQRKIDERKEKLETAQKKVRELNYRFADWYYVVSESTYRKLRLNREQLFKTTQPTTPAPGPGTTAPGTP